MVQKFSISNFDGYMKTFLYEALFNGFYRMVKRFRLGYKRYKMDITTS